MKKACAFIVFAVLLVCLLFADSSWYVSREVDDFGDPTGRFSVRIDDLSGTYKNTLTSNGNLKYSIEVKDNGALYIYLLEGGKAGNLTTTSYGPYLTNTDEEFEIQIKLTSGKTVTSRGKLMSDENYKYIVVGDVWRDYSKVFIDELSLKVFISATNGSYSLGSIDVSGVSAEMFYDRTLFDEGLALMSNGEFQKAIDLFAEFKKKDSKAYTYFNVEESIAKCKLEIAKIEYDKARKLIDSREYQKAFEVLSFFEKQYPQEYQLLDAKKIKREVGIVSGLWEVGSVGPAGGYIIYDKGYYSDGWRFLEAAPGSISLINGTPIIDSTKKDSYIFSPATYIKNYKFTFVNGSDTYRKKNCTETGVGTGKNNTQLIISFLKEKELKKEDCAAYLCYSLSYVYEGVVYDDWFLPSIDELVLMLTSLSYDKLKEQGGTAGNICYWSSSEYEYDKESAWFVFFNSKVQERRMERKDRVEYLEMPLRVLPFRAF